ncbi:MAG: hypothetical protein BAJALOKI1v1_950002 [Promethearchaeota archaeon]|nr:MAG: hypothetical protein BAJALOKI1v1_950002 [Candidatus Lokiarchaeota archaeon]
MIDIRKGYLLILFFLSISFISIFGISQITTINQENDNTLPLIIINQEPQNPQKSNFWDLTGSPILINGTAEGVGAHNWSWAISNEWCSGNGTLADPYLLENITINGLSSNSCITILNSNAYFKINNCTLSFSANGSNAAIKLVNASNGLLLSNNLSDNSIGILIIGGNNNRMEYNYIFNSSGSGIEGFGSFNNSILSNTIVNNSIGVNLSSTMNGDLQYCNDNNISLNNFKYNNYAIALFNNSDNTTITKNKIIANTIGLSIENITCKDTLIFYNAFLDNTLHAFDNGTNNEWNNSVVGNYWNNHTSPDSSPIDAIIDIPYEFIQGGANSSDTYPLASIPYYNGSLIEINETTDTLYTWSQLSRVKWWCEGSGSESDPYLIQDLIIDVKGQGSGISIFNSESNFLIKNCTIYNAKSDEAGIFIQNSKNGIIQDCNLSNNYGSGLFLDSSNRTVVLLNNFIDNEIGINMAYSYNNNISLNEIFDNALSGCYLLNSSLNFLDNNNLYSNLYGLELENSQTNTIYNNSINSNSNGIMLITSLLNNITKNNIFDHNILGINLSDSNLNNFSANNISFNLNGVYLSSSNNNTLKSNSIEKNNEDGAILFNSYDNNITGNQLYDNSLNAINIIQSAFNFILGNDINQAANGIRFDTSENNFVSKNNISSNTNGLHLINSNSNKITLNNISKNFLCGINLSLSNGNEIFDNIQISFNDYYGMALVGSNLNKVSNNSINENKNDGVNIVNSNYNNITQNSIKSNENSGVAFYSSMFNTISANIEISENQQNGIFLYESIQNVISNNNVFNNSQNGVLLRYSDENTIENNNISANLYSGLSLSAKSDDNILTSNDLIMNGLSGINLSEYCYNNQIIFNNATQNSEYAIFLSLSSGKNNVTANFLIKNGKGCIYETADCKANIIQDNYCQDIYGRWFLDPFIIDDSGSSPLLWQFTWEEVAEMPWCSGNGTSIDPYQIHNITIDAENVPGRISYPNRVHALQIRNSSAYFILNNCTLKSSNSENISSGIYLYNVKNGEIINNNCSLNNIAIFLEESSNNTFSGNILTNCREIALYLQNNCNNNSILNNDLSMDSGVSAKIGICLDTNCNYNTLFQNNISNYEQYGLYVILSDFNNITKNQINNISIHGIFIKHSINSTIIQNEIEFSEDFGIYLSGENHTLTANLMYSCGIGVFGTLKEASSHTIPTSNNVNDRTVYYYQGQVNLTSGDFEWDGMPGQIILVNCNHSQLTGYYNISEGTIGTSFLYCNNNTLKNLNASNSNRYGIYLFQSSQCTLFNITANYNQLYGIFVNDSCNECNLTQNSVNSNIYGIYLQNNCLNCTLFNNSACANARYGIFLYDSCNFCNISGNNIDENGKTGIHLENNCNNCTIYKNEASNCGKCAIWIINSWNCSMHENLMYECGINIEGSKQALSSHTIPTSNKVNNRTVYYYQGRTGLASTNFEWAGMPGQILLVNCNDSLVYSSASPYNLSHGSISIMLHYCYNNSVEDIDASYNTMYGIYLTYSEDNFLFNTTVLNNDEYGVYLLHYCNLNNITENNVSSNNQYAITLTDNCDENLIFKNLVNANANDGIVLANNCDNNLILENEVNNNGGYAILLQEGCDLNEINCTNSNNEIHLENNCNSNILFNNTIMGGSHNGISLEDSCDNNEILSNKIFDCANHGISLQGGCDFNEINCTNSNNEIHLENNCNSNILFNNTIMGGSHNGISLENSCNNNEIHSTNLYNNGDYGIYIYNDCDGNLITMTNITLNGNDGIYITHLSDSNKVIENIILNNTGNGVHLYDQCNSNNISLNIIRYNQLNGIYLEDDDILLDYNDNEYTFSWFDASFGTELLLNDDNYTSYTLPFEFQFYDTNFSTVYISANGYLSFSDSTPNDYTEDPLPSSDLDNYYLIAPFWDDFQTAYGGGGGTIYVQNTEINSQSCVVIQWVDIQHYNGKYIGNLEVLLFESGDIVFNYLNINYTADGYVCGLNFGKDSIYSEFLGLTNSTQSYSRKFSLFKLSTQNILEKNNITSNILNGIYFRNIFENSLLNNNASMNGQSGVFLNNSDGNNLIGNLIYDNFMHGINLYNSTDVFIHDNELMGNTQNNIYLEESSSNTIFENQVNTNSTCGIHLTNNSNTNNITANVIENNDICGINITDSESNLIDNNTLIQNQNGICLFNSRYTTISNNNITENKVGIFLDSSDYNDILSTNQISINMYSGINLTSSNNNEVSENNISQNDYGIYLENSDDNTISNNYIFENNDGIFLNSSNSNNINNNNVIENNLNNGICLKNSFYNTIDDNYVASNKNGIFLEASNQNTISSNEITDNEVGLVLVSSDYNDILSNIQIFDNIFIGINLTSSDYNEINGNILTLNPYGIYLGDSEENTISNNDVGTNTIGLLLDNSNTNYIISGNEIYSNLNCGINITDSINNEINGNNIYQNEMGIYLQNSNSTLIRTNTIDNNNQGICLDSSNSNEILSNNNINTNSYCGINITNSLYNEINGNNIFENKNGICLQNSNQTVISNNDIYKNEIGVLLSSSFSNNITANSNIYNNTVSGVNITNSEENRIYDNIFSSNTNAISLITNANNNLIYENSIINNEETGLYIFQSTSNNITYNDFFSNFLYGIRVIDLNSQYNLFYENNFTGNGRNAWDTGDLNNWNTSYIGNYWDDYTGKDANDDGIGDIGYAVNGTQQTADFFHLDHLPKWWDAPVLLILQPANFSELNETIPLYIVSIVEGAPNCTIWYEFNKSTSNSTYTVFGSTSMRNGSLGGWEDLTDGYVNVTFRIKDARGYENSTFTILNRESGDPFVFINSPYQYQLFGVDTLAFNVSIFEGNLDKTWYVLNGSNGEGISEKTFFEGIDGYNLDTIQSSIWEMYGNGTVTITFYANDTFGNMNSSTVIVRKDIIAPLVTINSPLYLALFGETSPVFNVSIIEPHLNNTWYTINNGQEIFFVGSNGINIEQLLSLTWINSPDGNVLITFHANDSVGNYNFTSIMIKKDTLPPQISIFLPRGLTIAILVPPLYLLGIYEPHLDSIWFSLEVNSISTPNISINSMAGLIDSETWHQTLKDHSLFFAGIVTFKFYANDTLGHMGSSEVDVVFYNPYLEDTGGEDFQLRKFLPLILLSALGLGALLFLGVYVIRRDKVMIYIYHCYTKNGKNTNFKQDSYLIDNVYYSITLSPGFIKDVSQHLLDFYIICTAKIGQTFKLVAKACLSDKSPPKKDLMRKNLANMPYRTFVYHSFEEIFKSAKKVDERLEKSIKTFLKELKSTDNMTKYTKLTQLIKKLLKWERHPTDYFTGLPLFYKLKTVSNALKQYVTSFNAKGPKRVKSHDLIKTTIPKFEAFFQSIEHSIQILEKIQTYREQILQIISNPYLHAKKWQNQLLKYYFTIRRNSSSLKKDAVERKFIEDFHEFAQNLLSVIRDNPMPKTEIKYTTHDNHAIYVYNIENYDWVQNIYEKIKHQRVHWERKDKDKRDPLEDILSTDVKLKDYIINQL